MSRRGALTGAVATAATLTGLGVGGYLGLVTGAVSLDLGLGRRVRPLGPITVDIAAPRDVVYAAATAPYAERRPRAMQEKVRILDRAEGMVLAAHRTPVGGGLTAVTVETVTFTPPSRIGFRLVRGPVPYVTETFELSDLPASTGDRGTGTRLVYTGELGTDLGVLGERWGDVVTRAWIVTVEESLETIRAESERRAGRAGPAPDAGGISWCGDGAGTGRSARR